MRVWRQVRIGVLLIALLGLILFLLVASNLIPCEFCYENVPYQQTVNVIKVTNDYVNTAVARTAMAIPPRTLTPR